MTFEQKKMEFIDYLCAPIEALEGGKGKKNAMKYRDLLEGMDEKKFMSYMRKFFKSEDWNLRLTVEPGEDGLPFNDILKASKEAGVELFEHLALPNMSEDPDKPIITNNKVMVGMINGRRLQQRVRKKNSTSVSISKRDPRFNQVTGADKTGRVTDLETYALQVQGAKYALSEFFGPRADDSVSKDQMYHAIIEKGRVSLDELDIERHNKQALVAAQDLFTAGMIGNDLITREYLLPRTLKSGVQDARGIKRKEDK